MEELRIDRDLREINSRNDTQNITRKHKLQSVKSENLLSIQNGNITSNLNQNITLLNEHKIVG